MLADGAYLRLDFDTYLDQRKGGCLGSSDKGRLWLRGEGWWWSSPLAPFKAQRQSSDEQLYGEACHAALLEGMHAYETRYIVEPSKRDYPEALYTVEQIKAALKDGGVYPQGASKFTKEDWAEAAEIYLPDQPVWDNVLADFRRQAGRSKSAIGAEMDFAIRAMRDLATGEDTSTAEMRELLSVGSEFPILAEVSYFYTDAEGVRHCCRFDKLIPSSTPDLKTIGNWGGRSLASVVDRHIKDMAYDVQCGDYQIGRQHMMRGIVDGTVAIHGGTEEERDHLEAMAHYDQEHRPSFAWIFYQKPTSAGNAPVLLPIIEPWKGPYHLAGFRKRAAAMALYHDCMARFGPDRPWGRIEQTHTTVETQKGGPPQIELGIYDWGPGDEALGEQEHFLG